MYMNLLLSQLELFFCFVLLRILSILELYNRYIHSDLEQKFKEKVISTRYDNYQDIFYKVKNQITSSI